ncbi:hypothetical protein Vretimale_8410 [Volvox reticuliferus]|uniref:Cupin type-2 domain-containing protein n=1 Tax=Volvox reticuliferus TaxID=1737510 RepID=A0A8J4CJH1_9CHLO|nr:hypothetical protein Vretifemale_11813 [Volvox reticuliferus]GIM03745.1 hypothetical protein Vretimale_8410 [Volvox reticuliferus]
MHFHALGSVLTTLLIILTPIASAQQRAKCRTLYPPYSITGDDAQYVSDPYSEGTWDGHMFASKHSNGEGSLEILRLSINPGHGWPPHRHFEADEWIYVLSGAGAYTYWAFEDLVPSEVSIGPGQALYNPQGQLHKMWNNGSELLILLSISKSLAPFEVLEDWPDTPGGGVGYVPHVAPWELSCAPGHEVGDEEEEPTSDDTSAEFDDGDVGVEDHGQAAWGEAGEDESEEGDVDFMGFDDDYGPRSEDDESVSCGCGGGDPDMSEDDITTCMADFDDVFDDDVYGGDDDGEDEPEFQLESELYDSSPLSSQDHDEL